MASAATVAASSFDMAVTSPQDLIDLIPADRWAAVKGKGSLADGILSQPQWVEPPGQDAEEDANNIAEDQGPSPSGEDEAADQAKPGSGTIRSKIFRLGDFVDTDAVSHLSLALPLIRELHMKSAKEAQKKHCSNGPSRK